MERFSIVPAPAEEHVPFSRRAEDYLGANSPQNDGEGNVDFYVARGRQDFLESAQNLDSLFQGDEAAIMTPQIKDSLTDLDPTMDEESRDVLSKTGKRISGFMETIQKEGLDSLVKNEHLRDSLIAEMRSILAAFKNPKERFGVDVTSQIDIEELEEQMSGVRKAIEACVSYQEVAETSIAAPEIKEVLNQHLHKTACDSITPDKLEELNRLLVLCCKTTYDQINEEISSVDDRYDTASLPIFQKNTTAQLTWLMNETGKLLRLSKAITYFRGIHLAPGRHQVIRRDLGELDGGRNSISAQ